MTTPMFTVRLTPYFVGRTLYAPVFLVTTPREDDPRLVTLLIDGRERKNKHWLYKSPCCDEELVYIGWQTEEGWFLRWKCLRCENESMTMHPGWKSPRPETTGRDDQVYATRRERSGY